MIAISHGFALALPTTGCPPFPCAQKSDTKATRHRPHRASPPARLVHNPQYWPKQATFKTDRMDTKTGRVPRFGSRVDPVFTSRRCFHRVMRNASRTRTADYVIKANLIGQGLGSGCLRFGIIQSRNGLATYQMCPRSHIGRLLIIALSNYGTMSFESMRMRASHDCSRHSRTLMAGLGGATFTEYRYSLVKIRSINLSTTNLSSKPHMFYTLQIIRR